jgi:hypothetical protein
MTSFDEGVNDMSKYGVIDVNVTKHYTSDKLQAFADRHSITYEKAESLAREMIYRKVYQSLRNKDPKVKEQRRRMNRSRRELAKQLNAFTK